MAEIKWHQFIKDSLIIFILGILYLIITINSIVLVKIFPNTYSRRARSNKDTSNVFRNESILDSLFPTDLQLPPYSSYKNAADQQELNRLNKMKGDEDAKDKKLAAYEAIIDNKKKDGLDLDKLTLNGSCSYQVSMETWAMTVHKYLEHHKLSPTVEWPYNWLIPYDTAGGSWTVWYFKFKIANLMMNQQWTARTLMKFFCNQQLWLMIPDWILFLAIPFSKTFSVNTLQPILPTFIWLWLFWIIGPILGMVTLVTFIWSFFPPGAESFNCNRDTKIDVKQEQSMGIKKYLAQNSAGCGPNIGENLIMLFIMGVSIWCVLICISWYRHPIHLHSSWWIINELEKLVNWGGKWVCLICLALAFIFFLRVGGFMLLWGGASMIFIWLVTLFKTLSPLMISPRAILEVFACNNDIIALLLTAIITLRVEQKRLLPRNVTTSMWGVWGLLLLMKVIVSIQKVISSTGKKSKNIQQ
jgi:hypothetical protein